MSPVLSLSLIEKIKELLSGVKLVKPSLFDATVIIAGISIVVGVLLLLILVFQLFGVIVPKIEVKSKAREVKKAKKKEEKKAAKAAKKAGKNAEPVTKAELVKLVKNEDGPTAVFKAPSPAPVVEQGISGEVVAAIAAAVAATEGQGAVVRSIKKKNVAGRNPWAQAANVDNTRPF